MRKFAALLAVVLATACGNQKITADEIRAAMPASSVVKIDAPQYTADAPGAGPALSVAPNQVDAAVAAAAVGKSPLAVTSYLFATVVNTGIFWALAPIAFVTTLPPTSCTDTACTWGPGSAAGDLNDWRLVVTKAGDGFDFTLSGQPKSPAGSPFVPVITGQAFPGANPHRGHGSFDVDFDQAWAGLARPASGLGSTQSDFGAIEVIWDARTSLILDVTFRGARNGDHPGSDPAHPNRVNAVYAFDATASSGGDLEIGWRTLAPFTVDAPESAASLHTQWLAGGAGVADARFGTPSLAAGSTTFSTSQCWAGGPAYAMTYDPPTGLTDASVCQIAPGAPVTITVP